MTASLTIGNEPETVFDPTLVYETQSTHLGDCWASVNWALAESERIGKTIRLSEYSDPGGFIASGESLGYVGKMIREMEAILDHHGSIEVVRELAQRKIDSDSALGSQYLPIRGGWKGRRSKHVACQLGAGGSPQQNLGPHEGGRIAMALHQHGFTPVKLGKPSSIAESVEAMRECCMFVGIDSGMSHIAHSMGLPVHILKANVPVSWIRWIHGNKAFNLHPTVQHFIDFLEENYGGYGKCSPKNSDRLTLLTANSHEYRWMADMTVANKRKYCDRWGIKLDHRAHSNDVLSEWGEREKYMLDALSQTDWLWFMGCDTLLCNQTIDVRKYCMADLVITWDRFGINNDSMILRNCPASVKFLNEVLTRRFNYKDDQSAMWAVLMENAVPELNVKILPQRTINSYRYDLYDLVGHWCEVEGQWCSGDLVLHVPGLSLQNRMDVLHETMSMVIDG